MARGILITCEGIDGSGKSTIARGLATALRERGIEVAETSEPTRTWLGEAVRRGTKEGISRWSEAMLFSADHADHVERILGVLETGTTVISDRWSDSMVAYQGAELTRPGFDAVAWLLNLKAPYDVKPDVTLLFNIDPEVAVERVGKRGAADKFERVDYLRRVQRNYWHLAQLEAGRFVVIDALRPEAVVMTQAINAVDLKCRLKYGAEIGKRIERN